MASLHYLATLTSQNLRARKSNSTSHEHSSILHLLVTVYQLYMDSLGLDLQELFTTVKKKMR